MKHSESHFTNAAGEPLQLVLYMYPSCPYCQRVMDCADTLGLDLPMRDIRKDPAARNELLEVGGKTMVPCLFINGRPMYESADIIRYLERNVRAA